MKTPLIERLPDEDFANVKYQWNALLARSASNDVFLSWEWMFSWWDAFKDDNKKLLILIGRDRQGSLIGIAPFYIEKAKFFSVRNRNVVRFCSSLETAPDHLDILCDKEFEQDFPEAVFAYLLEHEEKWDTIRFDGIKDNSIIKSHLTRHQEELRGLIVDCSAQSDCPYLVINKSYEAYISSFSGKTRNTLLRKRKLLLEKEKYEYSILSADTADLDKYIKELFSLHAERTKRKKVETAFAGKKLYRFHENFIRSLLKEDKIVIAFLSKGTEFLAVYYCIKHNNKYYYYQTGISKQGERKSAGTVLLSLMIEKAFYEGCREFDFLRGSEKYKYFWTKDTRTNYSLFIRKNNFLNKVKHHLSINFARPGKKIVKKILCIKRSPETTGPRNNALLSTSKYTVKIATVEEFQKSKDAWNKLASDMPIPSVFCTWEWVYTWWEHFGKNYKPLILFVYKGTDLRGILPLASQETMLNREGITGRILTYCGSRELYPDHLDVIAAQEHAGPCIDALCTFLSTEYRAWDVSDFKLFAEGSNFIAWLNKNMHNRYFGFDVVVKQTSSAHFIPLRGSFEEYINTFDTKQRYNLRSRKKKLEQEGFRYRPCDPSQEATGFDALFEIHALRSKKKKIQSTFNDSDIRAFHKKLATRISKQGWLSLRFLRGEKNAIAASYNFCYEGRVFSYQKGMDPKWERYGPGKAIVYEAIQEAFLNGNKEYNFLQGNEEYKGGWARESRALFNITLYNKTAGGIISKELFNVKKIIKKMIGKHEPAPTAC